ncbi:ABC transporter family protein [Cryptosporidium serpentis]
MDKIENNISKKGEIRDKENSNINNRISSSSNNAINKIYGIIEQAGGRSIWSKVFFTWITPWMWKFLDGYINTDDLPHLPNKDNIVNWTSRLEDAVNDEEKRSKLRAKKLKIARPLLKVFWLQGLLVTLLKIFYDILQTLATLALRSFVASIEPNKGNITIEEYQIKTSWCSKMAILFVILTLLKIFVESQYSYWCGRVSLRIQGALISMTFRRVVHWKALAITSSDSADIGKSARKSMILRHAEARRIQDKEAVASSNIFNLIVVDALAVEGFLINAIECFVFPFRLIVAFFVLKDILGTTTTACGMATLIILLIISFSCQIIASSYKAPFMSARDKRIDRCHEVLSEVRTLQMMGLQEIANERVMRYRNMETRANEIRTTLSLIGSWIGYQMSSVAQLVLFLMAVYYGINMAYKDNIPLVIPASVGVTTLKVLFSLLGPCRNLSMYSFSTIEAIISFYRFESFIRSRPLDLRHSDPPKTKEFNLSNIDNIKSKYSKISKNIYDRNKWENTEIDKNDIDSRNHYKAKECECLEYFKYNNIYNNNLNQNNDDIILDDEDYIEYPLLIDEKYKEYQNIESGNNTNIKDNILYSKIQIILMRDACYTWYKDIRNRNSNKIRDKNNNFKEIKSNLKINNSNIKNINTNGLIKSNCNQDYKISNYNCELIVSDSLYDNRFKLRNINLSLTLGETIIVVGSPGSGKTSLMNAILDEIVKENGTAFVQPRETRKPIAYASQIPWIPNGSIKNTIIFGRKLNQRKYDIIIDCCQLNKDFSTWQDGDSRVVDEGGFSLSGGQRARICLARALYSLPDILFENTGENLGTNNIDKLNEDILNNLDDNRFQNIINIESESILNSTKLNLESDIKSFNIDKLCKLSLSNINKLQCSRNNTNNLIISNNGLNLNQKINDSQYNEFNKYSTINDINMNDYNINTNIGSPLIKKSTINTYKPIDMSYLNDEESILYLLDDIFISLDPGVSQIIFRKLFGLDGLLRRVGTILSIDFSNLSFLMKSMRKTSLISFKPNILVLDDGMITFYGCYQRYISEWCNQKDSDYLSNQNIDDIVDENDNMEDDDNINNIILPYPISTSTKTETLRKVMEKEGRLMGIVSKKTYFWYFSKLQWNWTFSLLFLCFAKTMFDKGTDYYMGIYTSRPPSNNVLLSISEAKKFAFNYTILVFIQLFVSAMVFIGEAFCGLKAATSIHNNILVKVLNAPLYFFDSNPVSRIISRFSADQLMMDNVPAMKIATVLVGGMNVMFQCCIVLYVAPLAIILFPLIGFGIYLAVARYFSRSSREIQRMCLVLYSPLCGVFSEAMSGGPIIRSFRAQSHYMIQGNEIIDLVQRAKFMQLCSKEWSSLRTQLLTFPLTVLTSKVLQTLLVSTGFKFFYKIFETSNINSQNSKSGIIGAGVTGIALYYSESIASNIGMVITSYVNMEKEMISAERLHQYDETLTLELSHDQTICKVDNNLDLTNSKLNNDINKRKGVKIENLQVRYRRPNSKPTDNIDDMYFPPSLDNMSALTGPNEHIGVIGRTGSGKSTFLQSILGLVPITKGQILLDDVPINQMLPEVKRKIIGVLPQVPLILKGWTVRNFLDPDSKHSNDDLWNAINICGLSNLIRSLPGNKMLDAVIVPDTSNSNNQYNSTPIENDIDDTDDGRSLSDSQLRYLSLARLVISAKNYRLILVDEPPPDVNHDDTTNYIPIHQLLRKYFPHCTVFVVAHHAASLQNCNKVWVIGHGKILHETSLNSNFTQDEIMQLCSNAELEVNNGKTKIVKS